MVEKSERHYRSYSLFLSTTTAQKSTPTALPFSQGPDFIGLILNPVFLVVLLQR